MNTPASSFLHNPCRGELRNDLARLAGARFVTASETSTGAGLDTAMVKSITGGEPITARFLNKEFMEFTPGFKLFMATNEAPEVPAEDAAIWERLRLIPFTVTIPEDQRDRDLGTKLSTSESLSGILAWAVKGCLRWQVDGLRAPESVSVATGAYRSEMDSMALFLEDCCDVDKVNPDLRTSPTELLNAFNAWAMERGESGITSRRINNLLTRKGILSKRSNGLRYYGGIRLKLTAGEKQNPNGVLVTDVAQAGDAAAKIKPSKSKKKSKSGEMSPAPERSNADRDAA